jgi:large subunit ribosomal protein L17
MRHGMVNRKLGRTSGHRAALFRNQLASLIQHERIVTTLPKAKELRPQIERLVTLGKTDNLHNRRQAGRLIADDTLVGKLFGTLGPRFAERPGGYTRIIKLGPRRGDAAERAIIEFVGYELNTEVEETPAPAKGKKAAPKKEAKPAKEAEDAEEETPKKKPASKKAAPKKKKEDGGEKAKKKPSGKKKSSK